VRVAVDVVKAHGHPNITALHETTFEVTKDSYLTRHGDCIVGIKADKSVSDLDDELKELIRNDDALIILIFLVSDNVYDVVVAHGSRKLLLSDNRKLIVRRSSYVCPATLGIKSNKAAIDLNRELVKLLRDGNVELDVIILGVLPE